jgi:hypothetical protein
MSGVIKCAFGGKYVSLELTINGCAAPITSDPGNGAEATSLFGCRSYQWEDAAFNIASSPRNLSNDHTLNFSNEVVPPNDMTALNGSRTPIALPNDGSPNWTVEFQEIMDDEVIRHAFLNGTEAAYVMQLHAPGVAEATFTMARGIFHEHKRTIASADRPGVVKDTGIRYQALAPYTDATAACIIAENATAS